MKLLIALDGSESALRALAYVFEHKEFFTANPELVLINVHLPIPSARAKAFVGNEIIEQYYREEFDEAMAPARALLAGKPCQMTERSVIGQPAAAIIAAATQEGCDLIVMGTHGRSAFGTLLMGSVAMRVIAASSVPVLSVR